MHGPLTLRDFGSYTAGGRLRRVTEGTVRKIAVTRDVTLEFDPKGSFAVEHAYVQYFVPEPRRPGPPVVLLHGGGLSGTMWETTPDGRPGWLQLLLARGFEVHVIDNVERGRAGFAPGLWEGAPILRSLEDAWSLFRLGPPEGFAARRPFAGQLFPVEALEALARGFVPRWLSTLPQQAAALRAVLERLGGAVLICHSQGAEPAFAAIAAGAPVAHLVAVEPSSKPAPGEMPGRVPVTLVIGDHLGIDPLWRGRAAAWRQLARDLAAAGNAVHVLASGDGLSPGHSHLPMQDRGHDACLDAILATTGPAAAD